MDQNLREVLANTISLVAMVLHSKNEKDLECQCEMGGRSWNFKLVITEIGKAELERAEHAYNERTATKCDQIKKNRRKKTVNETAARASDPK